MCAQVDLRSEGCHHLLVSALVLFAQEVLRLEVLSHFCDRGVEKIDAIGIAKMAEIMFLSQVSEQLILVQISQLTVVAKRVAFVRLVVGIADSFVSCELTSCVAAALLCKNLQIVGADLAVKQLVHFSNVLLKLLKVDERLVVAFWAAVLEKSHKTASDVLISKSDPEFFIVKARADLPVQGRKRRDCLRENHLEKQLLS